MVVSLYRYGRLGNRLFTFSNLIAFSELFKVPILMPAFSDYRKLFPFFLSNPFCAYGFPDGKIPRFTEAFSIVIWGRLGLLPSVRFWDARYVYFDKEDLDDKRVQEMIHSKVVVFEGWDFCSRRAITEFKDKIRKVFTPQKQVAEKTQELAAQMRSRAEILVGVHVRWGDYRGTDRFFDLTEYADRMQEVRSIFSPAKVAFAIFSPEKVSPDSLPENSYVRSGGRAVEDMYALAECDYLIGPPSTFSMWASYYGGRPLFLMRKGEHFSDKSVAKVATP